MRNFNVDVIQSECAENNEIARVAYKLFFPTLKQVVFIDSNSGKNWLEKQKQGIDAEIYHEVGAPIFVDNKFRDKEYDDYCVEIFSTKNDSKKIELTWEGFYKAGQKSNYIAYFIKPLSKVYFIDYLQMKNFMRNNFFELNKINRIKSSENTDYKTWNRMFDWDYLRKQEINITDFNY